MIRYPCPVNVMLESGYHERESQFGPVVSYEDVDSLNLAIVREVVEIRRPMTEGEFRFLRKMSGLTQEALAKVLKIDAQTVSLWERGKHAIPLSADFVLRSVAQRLLVPDAADLTVARMEDIGSALIDANDPIVMRRVHGRWISQAGGGDKYVLNLRMVVTGNRPTLAKGKTHSGNYRHGEGTLSFSARLAEAC